MGTALTEQQLRELGRLTKRLWLAFDGDAAGEAATLRGMELAVAQGFDVKVVALPPGVDPADDPHGLRGAARRRRAVRRSTASQVEARARPTTARPRSARGQGVPRRACPTRSTGSDAWRWANDQLRHDDPDRAAAAPRRAAVAPSPRARRRRRQARAGRARRRASRIPSSCRCSPRSPPEHFHDETHRALRAHLVDGAPLDRDCVGAARRARRAGAATEGIDERTGKELLLRLREREMRRELQARRSPRARRSSRKRCSACSNESQRCRRAPVLYGHVHGRLRRCVERPGCERVRGLAAVHRDRRALRRRRRSLSLPRTSTARRSRSETTR